MPAFKFPKVSGDWSLSWADTGPWALCLTLCSNSVRGWGLYQLTCYQSITGRHMIIHAHNHIYGHLASPIS